MLAATASELRRLGPLAAVSHSITDRNAPPRALPELPARRDLGSANPALALGRRWRHNQPDFWERLSPLHRQSAAQAAVAAENAQPTEGTAPEVALQAFASRAADSAADPEAEAFHERLHRLRQAKRDEIQSGLASRRATGPSEDLRPSGVDGLMPDPENDLVDEEGSWL